MKDKNNNPIALGIIFGVMFGVIFDNVALGMCFGVVFGALFSQRAKALESEEGGDKGGEAD